jgi:hypothetical protein
VKPRPLIITGMARSGTTMLQQLCDSHPQMRVTKEFGNYAWIGESFPSYVAKTINRIRVINGKWRILGPSGRLPSRLTEEIRIRSQNHVANVGVAARHLLRLARRRPGRVTLSALVDAAGGGAPQARIVGDKLPLYAFMLDSLIHQTELLRMVIYRDCRDVTSSFLRKVRTDWKSQAWSRNADTAQKIARRWVRAIENMEHHADRLWIVRYEDLVREPRLCMPGLAAWLDVDPSGFDARMVFDSSVGKYKQGLTAQEHDIVLEIAGPTMERLGYSLD